MARFKDASRKQAKREIAAVNKKIREGYPAYVAPGTKTNSAVRAAAEELKLSRHSLKERVGSPKTAGAWKLTVRPRTRLELEGPQKEKRGRPLCSLQDRTRGTADRDARRKGVEA